MIYSTELAGSPVSRAEGCITGEGMKVGRSELALKNWYTIFLQLKEGKYK